MEPSQDKLDTLISLLQSLVPVIQQSVATKTKTKAKKKVAKKKAKKKTAKKAIKKQPQPESEEDSYIAPSHNIRTRSRKNFRANNEPFNNKFDKMSEASMHKEDTKVDKLLSRSDPVARVRPGTLVKVVCKKCRAEETVSNKLLYSESSGYKCNRCSSTEGD
jgi:hypothetical protein